MSSSKANVCTELSTSSDDSSLSSSDMSIEDVLEDTAELNNSNKVHTVGLPNSTYDSRDFSNHQDAALATNAKRFHLSTFLFQCCFPFEDETSNNKTNGQQDNSKCEQLQKNETESFLQSKTFQEPFSLSNTTASHHCNPITPPFLGEQRKEDAGKKTLVLDLDETLIHSSFNPSCPHHFSTKVLINSTLFAIYIAIRPGVDSFLEAMSKYYEIIVYTASTKSYATNILSVIDPHNYISACLYRDYCNWHQGCIYKDISKLGRDLSSVVVVDNDAINYQFQPNNGIECQPFYGDPADDELSHLQPFLQYLSTKSDVRKHTKLWNCTQFLRKSCD